MSWKGYLAFMLVALMVYPLTHIGESRIARFSTDVVIVEYVDRRPFGQNSYKLEFVVHERIFGDAADTIFVYISDPFAAWRRVGEVAFAEELYFSEGSQYLLMLYRIVDVYSNTHENGHWLRSSGSNIQNMDNSFVRAILSAYYRVITLHNTPAREYIRSNELEIILAGSPYVLVVEINEILRPVHHQACRDWFETDIFLTTIVEPLKGFREAGEQARIIFFADTVQQGEKHIVAVTEGYFNEFTSRYSLIPMERKGDVLEILANIASQ